LTDELIAKHVAYWKSRLRLPLISRRNCGEVTVRSPAPALPPSAARGMRSSTDKTGWVSVKSAILDAIGVFVIPAKALGVAQRQETKTKAPVALVIH
jgi:hypothetical protein